MTMIFCSNPSKKSIWSLCSILSIPIRRVFIYSSHGREPAPVPKRGQCSVPAAFPYDQCPYHFVTRFQIFIVYYGNIDLTGYKGRRPNEILGQLNLHFTTSRRTLHTKKDPHILTTSTAFYLRFNLDSSAQ